MLSIIYSLSGFLLAIGVLTTVHEFGHFWVARKLGIKVLKFSIGLGKPIITWFDKSGTKYQIAAIPLGGFVQMLDERESKVDNADLHMAFNNKSKLAQSAVILAGPAANFLLAIVCYLIIFLVGIKTLLPIIAEPPNNSAAKLAGLTAQQQIMAIDDKVVNNWEEIYVAILSHLGKNKPLKLAMRNKNQEISSYSLNVANWSMDESSTDITRRLGLLPYDPTPPIIGKVISGYPADKAGLIAGDKILAVNQIKVENRIVLAKYIQQHTGKLITLNIKRKTDIFNITLMPDSKLLDGGQEIGFIGIEFKSMPWPESYYQLNSYPLSTALYKASQKTYEYSVLTLKIFSRMLVGEVSIRHMGGPVSIAKYAGDSVRLGALTFINFIGLISISLGVINLLPIPILDGGQLFMCCIEGLTNKPIPDLIRYRLFKIGIFILMFITIIAIYNDIMRFLA